MECVSSVGTFIRAQRCINLHFSTVAAPERHDITPDSFVEFHGQNDRLDSQTHDDIQSSGGLEITKPFSSLETRQTLTAANSSDVSGGKLSRSDQAWMKKYQLLLEFRLQNQQSPPALLVPTTNPTLGRWAQRQRSEYKRGQMATWRRKALDDVGFVWDVREYQRRLKERSEEKYDNEEDITADNGNGNENENGKKHSIAKRTNFKPNNDRYKVKKWRKLSWDERYAQLVDYHRVHGHVNVPLKDPIYGSLGGWVQYQRRSRYSSKPNNSSKSKSKSATSSASKLTKDQVSKLEDLGFVWDLKEHRWMERYRELVDFVKKYGHCHVPGNGGIGKGDVDINDDGVDYKSLQAWCGTQRHLFRLKYKIDRTGKQDRDRVDEDDCDGNDGCYGDKEVYNANATTSSSKTSLPLTDEREALLNKINFDWDTNHSYIWNKRMEQLQQYKRRHGHINLTKADDTKGAETEFDGLGSWLDTQRTEYRFKMDGLHTHLSDNKVEDLERLGIVWSIRDLKWNAKYEEVKKILLCRSMLQEETTSAEFGCGVGENRNRSHALPTGLFHNGALTEKLPPSLSVWLRDQKRYYRARLRGESTPLSDDRAEKLKILLDMI